MIKIATTFFIFLLAGIHLFAQVGINADNSTPDVSAGLDVNFTNKGILPPRVALTAVNSPSPVTSPAVGLLIYNTAVAGTPPNNVMSGYYCWSGTKWIAVLPPQGTSVGDMQYWNGTQWVRVPAGSNGQVLTLTNGVPTWGSYCGMSMTINHVAGATAPVTKTVTYGTVTNVPGAASKCWITSNLGADHQATWITDATEASAGWYFQFNRKQGYKHDGSTRTPNTPWITLINDPSDWTIANDPCNIELGAGWRIPTSTEWTNVDASGNWTEWFGTWNSYLKLHAGGSLIYTDGSLGFRGQNGTFWSTTQYSAPAGGYNLGFNSTISDVSFTNKTYGFTLRCLRDN